MRVIIIMWPLRVRIIVHPFVKMIGKIETAVTIGGVLKIDQSQTLALIFSLFFNSFVDQNVTFMHIIVTKILFRLNCMFLEVILFIIFKPHAVGI